MKQYVADIQPIFNLADKITQAGSVINRSFRKRFSSRITQAGHDFLKRIHTEIEQTVPQWQKDAKARELAEEREQSMQVALERPELTVAYLTSIGYEP